MRTWQSLPRQDQPELLDLGAGTLADVRVNLSEMWRINHFLGGFRALTCHLYPRLSSTQGTITLADLGSGSADVPLAILDWARRHKIPLHLAAVDWAPRNLSIAREHTAHTREVELIQADAAHLPFAKGGIDFVISSLFLHHFSPVDVIDLLRMAYDRANKGIIMSDLVRGRLPLAAFQLVQPVFARHFLTRHDGTLSIRRAYTPGELRHLAEAAGLHHARIYTHWPWRMTLVADK
ncbi:MAG TPA: methyltransferase domain-containing protein [Aggregatilineaceae bacterium]|nr:methyltransferase domain-containing protein [Aggregatilineaceae bacterium]